MDIGDIYREVLRIPMIHLLQSKHAVTIIPVLHQCDLFLNMIYIDYLLHMKFDSLLWNLIGSQPTFCISRI